MKETIQEFLNDKKVAIVGASNKKDNFGRSIMTELSKAGYEVFPVNPRCEEVEGVACVPSVRDLPEQVKGVILAIPSTLTEEVVSECAGTPIKRVWMIKGMGRGAYSEKAHELCKAHNIEVVYGFCPMMFFGKGMHKFHLWLRKTFSSLPEEYILS
jgi:predicted CoA-binding protein